MWSRGPCRPEQEGGTSLQPLWTLSGPPPGLLTKSWSPLTGALPNAEQASLLFRRVFSFQLEFVQKPSGAWGVGRGTFQRPGWAPSGLFKAKPRRCLTPVPDIANSRQVTGLCARMWPGQGNWGLTSSARGWRHRQGACLSSPRSIPHLTSSCLVDPGSRVLPHRVQVEASQPRGSMSWRGPCLCAHSGTQALAS